MSDLPSDALGLILPYRAAEPAGRLAGAGAGFEKYQMRMVGLTPIALLLASPSSRAPTRYPFNFSSALGSSPGL
jgi:hypothetical protein